MHTLILLMITMVCISTSSGDYGDYEECRDGDIKETDDGCNTCHCVNGQWKCTRSKRCEEHPECRHGDVKDADDGCNRCHCRNGQWTCTNSRCEERPECRDGDVKVSDDGCNSCRCIGVIWACTRKLCHEEPVSAPRNVHGRPLSPSTMVIQWDEPITQNGQITGYKIYYTTNPSLPIKSWKSQPVQDNEGTTISYLTPNTIYTIRVQAYTGIGPGPLSDPVQVKTQQEERIPCDAKGGYIGEKCRDEAFNGRCIPYKACVCHDGFFGEACEHRSDEGYGY